MRVLILCLALQLAARAQPTPMVPFQTGFSHWEHHWIMWPPNHPIYEAVEVMIGAPGAPKLVRVFFTERAGSKKQVYYFNDKTVADSWPTGETFYRSIDYRTEGDSGKPLSLRLKFADKNNQPVELAWEFDSGQDLGTQYAGLSPQAGHGADSVFMLFYRERTATAARSSLTVNGEDLSIHRDRPGQQPLFYRTGYRHNVYVGVVRYEETRFTRTADGWTTAQGALFRRDGTRYATARDERGGRMEFDTGPAGQLHEFRHTLGDHVFRITFDPPLPAFEAAKPGMTGRYSMSIDRYAGLAEGEVVIGKDGDLITLDWRHERPDSVKPYNFRSVLSPLDSGFSVKVARTVRD